MNLTFCYEHFYLLHSLLALLLLLLLFLLLSHCTQFQMWHISLVGSGIGGLQCANNISGLNLFLAVFLWIIIIIIMNLITKCWQCGFIYISLSRCVDVFLCSCMYFAGNEHSLRFLLKEMSSVSCSTTNTYMWNIW